MENQYTCIYDIDKYRDARIKFNGDGQEVEFGFMIPFVSVPSLLFFLLQLWNGKTNQTEIMSFGFSVRYYFTVEDEDLLIEHSSYHDDEYITRNYKFNFEKFAKALYKGFSEYLQEQKNKGLYPLPLEVDEYCHHLSNEVIEKFEEFSTIINESELNMIRPVEEKKNTLLDDVPAIYFLKSEKEGIEFLLKNDYKKVNGLGYYVVSFHGEGLEETVLQTVFDDLDDAENCMELLVQRLENGHGRGILGI